LLFLPFKFLIQNTLLQWCFQPKTWLCQLPWQQWRSSMACRPWISPILPPPPILCCQHSITAEIFLWRLLAVQNPNACYICWWQKNPIAISKFQPVY